MAPPRIRLGELLVEAQIITHEQLEEVLAIQKRDGRRIGTLLVESGLVTETQVTQILSQQLALPWVSLYHIDFSRQLLNLVPRNLAESCCLVPIFVRRVRGIGETLYVAMDDPSDEKAIRELEQYSGLPIRAMIAPPSDIRAAIRVYYGAGSDSASLSEAVAEERQIPSQATQEPSSSTAAAPATREQPAETPAPSRIETTEVAETSAPAVTDRLTPPPDSGPQISAREITMPLPRKGKGARMITLTLLDGTRINLPARGSAKTSEEPSKGDDLTARDLVAALRAVAHGADATEVLGENVRWEAMFAALLALLLRKHLIADWEFVEEYKKV